MACLQVLQTQTVLPFHFYMCVTRSKTLPARSFSQSKEQLKASEKPLFLTNFEKRNYQVGEFLPC